MYMIIKIWLIEWSVDMTISFYVTQLVWRHRVNMAARVMLMAEISPVSVWRTTPEKHVTSEQVSKYYKQKNI